MASPDIDQRRPLRRVEYDQLAALGAFEDERIELLDGEIVRMSPPGPPHADSGQASRAAAARARGTSARASAEPFAASEVSEPEPDISVVPLGNYRAAHPEKAHLLVEVSESSLATDRGRKARLYAECGVPEYWIVNLVDGVVEVHREPARSGYQNVTRHGAGSLIAPSAFPDVQLRVDDFL